MEDVDGIPLSSSLKNGPELEGDEMKEDVDGLPCMQIPIT